MGHISCLDVAEPSAVLKNETIRKCIWPLMDVITCLLQMPPGLCGAARMIHDVYGSLLWNCEYF